jgi:hypothetical protein
MRMLPLPDTMTLFSVSSTKKYARSPSMLMPPFYCTQSLTEATLGVVENLKRLVSCLHK